MATRGTALLVLGLFGALLSTTTGCTGSDRLEQRPQESGATPSPTLAQAREDLLQALRRTQGASHRYTVRGSLPEGQSVQASGAFDPKGRLFEAKIKTSGGKDPSDTRRVVVDKHSYLRMESVSFWVHLDLARVPEDSLVYFDMSDPTGLVKFTSVIGSVRQTGPNAYAGRFNPDSGFDPFVPVGAPSVASFGITVADFTATTDGKGWVTSITVELEPLEGPKISMTTTLSDHGTKLSIKAPPKAQVREADGSYYKKK
jgi:hypothetical protein